MCWAAHAAKEGRLQQAGDTEGRRDENDTEGGVGADEKVLSRLWLAGGAVGEEEGAQWG